MSFCHSCSHYHSLGSPRKELIQSSGDPNLVTVAQETSPNHLALGASRVCVYSRTGIYFFAFLKSCCLRLWLPTSLNPRATEILPFRTLSDLGHPEILGAIKNKIGCMDNHKGLRDNHYSDTRVGYHTEKKTAG